MMQEPTFMELFFSSGAALVITALGGFLVSWITLKWKHGRQDRTEHDLRDKMMKLEKQRCERRLNKYATLLSGANGRFLEVSGRAQLILDNNKDGFDGNANRHCISLRDWSKQASDEIISTLEEISDISEVVNDDDIEEVMDEEEPYSMMSP